VCAFTAPGGQAVKELVHLKPKSSKKEQRQLLLSLVAYRASRLKAILLRLDWPISSVTFAQIPARLEKELRLAREYWLQTILPYIAGRKLLGVELFVAQHAHDRLAVATRQAREWNSTNEGKLSPVPAEIVPDLSADQLTGQFRPPEPLFADESLKPEMLAMIAAPILAADKADCTPARAIRIAHELLSTAQDYVRTLPKRPDWESDFQVGFSTVTFDEVQISTKEGPGQLPLLPGVARKRAEITHSALRKAVRDYSDRNPLLLTEQDRNECLESNHIGVFTLCQMRWQRFKRFWEGQSTRRLKKPGKTARPKPAKGEDTKKRPLKHRRAR
jgi:hypothetical protein